MSQEVQTVFPTRLPKRKALKEIHSEVIKTRVNLKKNGRIVTSSDKVVKVEVKVKIEEEEDEIERRSRMLGCTILVVFFLMIRLASTRTPVRTRLMTATTIMTAQKRIA